jgi:putative nucleotidyltransferase with HDIG domain
MRSPHRSFRTSFDSYRSPEAEALLRSGRERFRSRSRLSRVLVTGSAAAILFLALALALALAGSSPVPISPTRLAITVAAYLVASRVSFPVAAGLTSPTQLVFVPMLFLLPVQLVPLIVAGCLVLDLAPDLRKGRVPFTRVLARIGDASYALGPATVLVLAHRQHFSWDAWPVLILAFAAQVAADLGCTLPRMWFADRISPRDQEQMLLWLYAVDLCLACVGLAVAASAVARPGLVLLTLPAIALLGLFARERQERVDSTLELSSAYRGTVMLLGEVVEADDEYTGIHSRQVVELSLAVADKLGLNATQRRTVEFGALLHDVGKIRVPSSIINKAGQLNDEEWAIMRRHTITGEEMLKQVGGTLSAVGKIVRSSHERFDGNGYPDGLVGGQIPIESRIISVCDAYNAMTTDRAYRAAMSEEVALDELRRCSGTQFDPAVVFVLDGLQRPSQQSPSQQSLTTSLS